MSWFEWLKDANTRYWIELIGGLVAVGVGAVWAMFTYFKAPERGYEAEELDPAYRRQMLYAWSRMLKERDDLIKQLNSELENVDILRFDRGRIDEILEQLERKDQILVSSRYSRVLHNVTWSDQVIVGLKSLFIVRPKAAAEALMSAATAAGFGLSIAYLAEKHPETFRWLKDILKYFGVSTASAATTPTVATNLDPIQVYIIVCFAALIAVGFVWFAITATLSKEAATRRTAMDMTKNVMLFMMGLVTGYLSNRH